MADCEIYIDSPDEEQLVNWIVERVGELKFIHDDVESLVFHGQAGGDVLPILIQKKVEDGPFVGIWFNSVFAPWDNDKACARDAFEYFGKTVQCDPGDDVKGDNQFFEISSEGERLITLE